MLQSQQILKERYQLQEQLSNNPTRQTWLALDVKAGKQVILKLLPLSPQTQWENIKLFEREAQVLKHLNHFRIPRYFDSFTIDKDLGSGLSWFALMQEYIPSVSLQQLLKTGKRFTEANVTKIARQLLDILIYLHGLSPPVLHRDLKPSNILQGKNGKIYLVDFGAVQDKAKAEGMTFTVVGTGGYAPPEQLWGRAVAASDLYALGATLIHLLTGIAPSELPQKEMRLQFRDRVKLSSGFANWLETLVDPEVERRFTRGKEALEALNVARQNQHKNPKMDGIGFEKINYGYIGIFSFVTLFLVSWLFIDQTAMMKRNSRQLEAINNIGASLRSQQAHVMESSFVYSLADLEIGLTNPTKYYEYELRATPLYAIHYATPRKQEDKSIFSFLGNNDIKGYVGIVALVPNTSATGEIETLTVSFMCETEKPTTNVPPDPIYKEGVIACPLGTKNIRGNGEIEINDRDWQLAYEVTHLAATGDIQRAQQLAETIDNKEAKEKALATIAQFATLKKD